MSLLFLLYVHLVQCLPILALVTQRGAHFWYIPALTHLIQLIKGLIILFISIPISRRQWQQLVLLGPTHNGKDITDQNKSLHLIYI